jgi:hypothetical protein
MTEMLVILFVYTLVAFVVFFFHSFIFLSSFIYAYLGRHSRHGMEEKSGSTLFLSFLFPPPNFLANSAFFLSLSSGM